MTELKTCKTCGESKETTHFYIKSKKTGTFRSDCKLCHSVKSAEIFRKPETSAARKKAYRKYHRFNLYGITEDAYNRMVEQQGGKCKICDVLTEKLCIDHCHDTGRVRGLLCNRCNVGIGYFRDDAILMEKAIGYLRI